MEKFAFLPLNGPLLGKGLIVRRSNIDDSRESAMIYI